MCSTEHNTPAQGAVYQTTTHDVGYYTIPAARTCLNLCLVSMRLPSSFRFGNLLPTISYLRASQGRLTVKIPTRGPYLIHVVTTQICEELAMKMKLSTLTYSRIRDSMWTIPHTCCNYSDTWRTSNENETRSPPSRKGWRVLKRTEFHKWEPDCLRDSPWIDSYHIQNSFQLHITVILLDEVITGLKYT